MKSAMKSQQGGAMLVIVVSLMAVSMMGTGVYYLNSSSHLGSPLKNTNARAYYLAESGYRYANPQIKADLDSGSTANMDAINNKTYTLSTGKFNLLITDTNPAYLLLRTEGIVNEDIWSMTKRNITYKIAKPPIDFHFDDSAAFNAGWDPIVAKSAEIGSVGPSDGEALRIQVHDSGADAGTALIAYRWNGAGWVPNSSQPDLRALWNDEGGLLNYVLQIKAKIDRQGGKGKYYLIGLSFRLDTNGTPATTDDDSYGVSFFRGGDPGDNNSDIPAWLPKLIGFNDLLGHSKVYVVLWKKNGDDKYALVDYRQLTAGDGVITTSGGEDDLKPWSTLVLKVEEKKDGPDGSRQNHISVFLMNQDTYPKGTINWDVYSRPVEWHSEPQPIKDSTFTSENFGANRPAELGMHALYDSNAQNDQFFSDFSMRLGSGNDGTGSGGYTWY